MQTMILSAVKFLKNSRLKIGAALSALAASLATNAWAGYDFNIPQPATPISQQIYGLHMYILIVCAVIFIIVFSINVLSWKLTSGLAPLDFRNLKIE